MGLKKNLFFSFGRAENIMEEQNHYAGTISQFSHNVFKSLLSQGNLYLTIDSGWYRNNKDENKCN